MIPLVNTTPSPPPSPSPPPPSVPSPPPPPPSPPPSTDNQILQVHYDISYMITLSQYLSDILTEKRQQQIENIFATSWLTPSVHYFFINLVQEYTNQKIINIYFTYMLLHNYYQLENLRIIRQLLLINYENLKQRLMLCNLIDANIFSST